MNAWSILAINFVSVVLMAYLFVRRQYFNPAKETLFLKNKGIRSLLDDLRLWVPIMPQEEDGKLLRLIKLLRIGKYAQTWRIFRLSRIFDGKSLRRELRYLGRLFETFQNREDLIAACFRANTFPSPPYKFMPMQEVKSKLSAGSIYTTMLVPPIFRFAPSLLKKETWAGGKFMQIISALNTGITNKIIYFFRWGDGIRDVHEFSEQLNTMSNLEHRSVPYLNNRNVADVLPIYKIQKDLPEIENCVSESEVTGKIAEIAKRIRHETLKLKAPPYTPYLSGNNLAEFGKDRLFDLSACDRKLVEQLAKFAVLEKPNLRHIMGVHIDYDIKFTDRMGAASVRGQGVENGLYVGLNTQYSIGRQLFWLIHEQCHLLLDHNGSFVQDPENYLKLMRNTEIHGQEAAAYLLSAELALPFVDISNMLDQGITDAEKLAEIFVVHPYQIMTRVIQITRKKYGDYGIYTGDDEAKKAYRDYTEDYYKILKLEPDDRADTAI